MNDINGIRIVQGSQQQEIDLLKSQVSMIIAKQNDPKAKPRTFGEIESERCWNFFCLK